MTPSTKIIIPQILEEQVKKITSNYLLVTPNNQYLVDEIKITSVPSYNINKPFHPKEKEYVGYILILENKKIYVMGDTDRTSELDNIKTDICFVPIGGTYTMNYQEAATYINYIKPKIVVPIHYGSIVGDISLKDDFESLIEKNIEVKTFIK